MSIALYLDPWAAVAEIRPDKRNLLYASGVYCRLILFDLTAYNKQLGLYFLNLLCKYLLDNFRMF